MAVVLKATKRSEKGTNKARAMRKRGNIPGIIYGHGQEPVAITLNEHDLEVAVQHGEHVLELDLEGQPENVLIKELQFDTFGHEIIHVDLARVDLDERVEVTVPIVLRGTPAGAKDGGVLTQVLSEATIECVVTAIPEDLKLSVNNLNIGDTLHLRDLPLTEGMVLVGDPNQLICSVNIVVEKEVAPPAEGEEVAAEPEVIREKKEEEGEAAPEGE